MAIISNPFLMKATLFSSDVGQIKYIKYNQIGLLNQEDVEPSFLETLLSDIKAKVSATDTTSGFLDDKIIVANDLVKSVINAVGNAQIQLSSNGRIRIDGNDTTFGYPSTKFSSTDGTVLFSIHNEGANEVFDVSAPDDHKVKVQSADTADYLDQKIKAKPEGNITIDEVDVGGVKHLEISASNNKVAIDYTDQEGFLADKLTASKGIRHQNLTGGGGVKNLDTQLYNFSGLTALNMSSLSNPTFAVQDSAADPTDIKRVNLRNLNWCKSVLFSYTGAVAFVYDLTLPGDGTTQFYFPYNGWYHGDFIIDFTAHQTNNLVTNFVNSVILFDLTDSIATRNLIKTPYFSLSIGKPLVCPVDCCCVLSDDVYVYRVNASCNFYVTGVSCTDKKIRVTLSIPALFNVSTQLNWIAQHYFYIAESEGSWCQ